MLPSLLVTAAVMAPGAPVPRDITPNTTGPAPRIVAVRADGNGAVWIMAQVYEKRKVQQQFFIIENGKQVMKQQEVEQNISNYIHKSLGDFARQVHNRRRQAAYYGRGSQERKEWSNASGNS